MAAMSLRTRPWPAGTPCWADLATPDLEQAKTFYGAVLGWDFVDAGPEYGGYVTAQARDVPAAGMSTPMEGMPAGWMMFFATDDADKTAAAIGEAGGSVLAPAMDVGPLGRMALGADPTGAAFGVWQAKAHLGAGIASEPGGLCWEDLRSTDPEAARPFYGAVFGHAFQELPAAGPDYSTFHFPNDPAPLGGMGGMMGMPPGTPSHWTIYFGVADIDAAVAAAEKHGGTIMASPFETPYGIMSAIEDPAGAYFWAMQTDWSQMPDRD
jgi:uncharacterized protein